MSKVNFLVCEPCGYNESEEEKKFVGIFALGTTLSTTDGEMCGLFGCPKCGTVKFVTDFDYIHKRKEEYKKKMKGDK